MTRTIVALVAMAVAAATAFPASAYTPNPEDPYYPKKPFPCIHCGVQVKPGDKLINPGFKRSLLGKGDRVSFNPQPEPPKGLVNFAR
jgi:hypothetical protein